MLVKKVFDDNLFSVNNLKASLEKICDSKTNTWRDYFIACPDLIEYCRQGFIRLINENNIILLKQSQMNHYHAEMYTYFLWKQYIEPRKELFKKSFEKIAYCDVIGDYEDAHIVLDKFCRDEINYVVNIYYCNNDNLPNPYEIAFRKKGENLPDKYGNDIKNILEKLDFEWNGEYKGYFFTSKDGDALIEKLENLNKEIQKL
jgi:hypothetical protein